MSALLRLPSELLTAILTHVSSSPDDPTAGIRDLARTGKTCTSLHHAVFCTTNDNALWHGLAVTLGIPPTVSLDAVVYPGSPPHEPRRWLHVVKLNYAWELPFPSSPPLALPKLQRARPSVPTQNTTVLMSAGVWARKTGAGVHVRTALRVGNNGTGTFGRLSWNIPARALVEEEEPLASVEPVRPPPWGADTFRYAGKVRRRRRQGDYIVHENPAGLQMKAPQRYWNLGRYGRGDFTACGELLVALRDVEGSVGGGVYPARNLVCLQGGDAEPGSGESKVLWEYKDIHEDWKDEDSYIQYPKIERFGLTSTHVVCLVTRYPTMLHQKLTRTEFQVLDLHTGAVCAVLRFPKKPLSSHPGIQRRANLTTALDHGFLLTDKFCVSGGQGGELLVWDYRRRAKGPLYAIPVRSTAATTGKEADDAFLRPFTSLSISTDGRYIGVTTSDQLFIVDMVSKAIAGRYSNGRRVAATDLLARNPNDGFPGGVWCWWKELAPAATSGEVAAGSSGVAFLMEPTTMTSTAGRWWPESKKLLWICVVISAMVAVAFRSGVVSWPVLTTCVAGMILVFAGVVD